MYRSLIFAAALLAASPLFAGNICNQRVVSHSSYVAPYVAPVYAQPQTIIQNQTVLYSVASDIRQYAITPPAIAQAQYGQLQRQLARLSDQMNEYREQASYAPQPQVVYVPVQAQPVQQVAPCTTGTCPPKMPPAAQQPAQQPAQPQQPDSPPAPENPKFSMQQRGVIQAKCLKCHGGSGQPKGDLDLRDKISCDQFERAIARLMTDDPDLRMPLKQPALSGEETAAAIKELLAMREEPKK